MQPSSAALLRDMLDAAGTIQDYVRGKTSADYFADRALRDAVQWNFAVIGEALSQLHKIDAPIAEQVREWNRIIGFRNQLVHGYGVIKHGITWDIIENKLPVLIDDLNRLLTIT